MEKTKSAGRFVQNRQKSQTIPKNTHKQTKLTIAINWTQAYKNSKLILCGEYHKFAGAIIFDSFTDFNFQLMVHVDDVIDNEGCRHNAIPFYLFRLNALWINKV